MTFMTPPPAGRGHHWDEDVSVPLGVAAQIVNRATTTVWNWHKAGMPTETLGGVLHVKVGDLLKWRQQHGRRHGRRRDY